MNTFPIISNCIAASAGTGKTYRLVSRYIALLCLGARPDSLVALTFTNKAAGEFRNRIMVALADGARFKPTPRAPRNPLAARVVDTIFGSRGSVEAPAETVPLMVGADPALLDEAARQGVFPEDLPGIRELLGHRLDAAYFCTLLESMVQQMCMLQLSTMDSFFQKLVSHHAAEIGVGEVRPLMGDEEEAARKEALLAMAGQHDTSESRRTAFIELCRDIYDDNVKSVIGKLLREVASNLFLLQTHAGAEDWKRFGAFGLPDVSDLPAITPEEWTAWEDEYNRRLERIAADFKPNSRPHQGVLGFLGKMKARNFKLPYVEAYLESNDFTGEAHNAMRELICEIRQRVWNELLRATEVKTRGMFELLSLYSASFRDAVVSTGRMSFEEMTRQAGNLLAEGAAEDLNQRYKHWMLDEFQDTNNPQWNALRSLLDEVVQENENSAEFCHRGKPYKASERSLFVVGDRKQGIYAFRGTNGELFSMLHGDSPSPAPEAEAYRSVLVPSSLSLSYRSARAIMGGSRRNTRPDGFINRLFKGIPDEELPEFCRHDTTRKALGYVQVRMLDQEFDAADLRGNLAPAAIRDVLLSDLTEDGTRLKAGMTVAVLVRTNEDAKSIVQYLHRHLPKLPMQLVGTSDVAAASSLGELLMSLFLWLRHPADSYRMNIVKLSPLRAIWQDADDTAAYARLTRLLDAQGYAAVVRDAVVPLFPREAHARTFDEWMAAAVEFDARGGTLDEWLDFMAQRSVKDAATTRAVQVMTMHKSKGLQFDAVIIPYIGTDAVDALDGLKIFEKRDAVLLSPGSANTREAFWESLEPMEEEWMARQRREAYNLMYVATTRAKFANYIMVRHCVKEEHKRIPHSKDYQTLFTINPRTEAGLVVSSLAGATSVEEGDTWFKKLAAGGIIYEQGTRDWVRELVDERAERDRAEPAEPQPAAAPKPLRAPAPRRRKVSPSKLEEPEGGNAPAPVYIPSLDSSEYGAGRSAADFGTAVHALFEQVEWLEDGAPLPFAPGDSAEAGIVCAALQDPGIAALFQRNGEQVAYAEQDIDAIDSLNGKEVWVSGTIDRLVLTMQGGSVAAASIIDFKTDKRRGPSPQDEDSALRERHFPQMKAYHNLVSSAFNLPSHKVTVTLVSCPANAASPRAIPYPPDTQW